MTIGEQLGGNTTNVTGTVCFPVPSVVAAQTLKKMVGFNVEAPEIEHLVVAFH